MIIHKKKKQRKYSSTSQIFKHWIAWINAKNADVKTAIVCFIAILDQDHRNVMPVSRRTSSKSPRQSSNQAAYVQMLLSVWIQICEHFLNDIKPNLYCRACTFSVFSCRRFPTMLPEEKLKIFQLCASTKAAPGKAVLKIMRLCSLTLALLIYRSRSI